MPEQSPSDYKKRLEAAKIAATLISGSEMPRGSSWRIFSGVVDMVEKVIERKSVQE